MKRIWAVLACMVFLSLSFFVFPVGAAKSDLVIGHTTEVGSGDKSPSNPYKLVGVSDGLPSNVSPLYGDGAVNDTYDPRTGIVTRWWKRLELTGTEYWFYSGTIDTDKFRPTVNLSGIETIDSNQVIPDIVCTHYMTQTMFNSYRCAIGVSMSTSGSVGMSVYDPDYSSNNSLSSWKSYLQAQYSSGNPVTIIYKLSSPEITLSYVRGDSSGYKRTSNVDFRDLGVQNTLYSGDTYVPFTIDGYNDYSHVMQVNTTYNSFELLMDPRMTLYEFLPGNKYRVRMDFFVPAGVSVKNVTYEISSGSTVILQGAAEPVKLSDGTTHYLIHAEFIPERSVEWNNYTIRYDADTTGSYYIYLNRYAYVDSISTDEFSAGLIVDGNGTPLAPDPGADGAMDDIGNAEDAALGGKTDEQIKQEVDNALNFDMGSLDQSAAAAMAGFFDGLLTHFGVDYQALLLLSLSLGLAAFIIGRRYKV